MRAAFQGVVLLVALCFPVWALATFFPGVTGGLPARQEAPRLGARAEAAPGVSAAPELSRPLDGYRAGAGPRAADRPAPLDATSPPTVTAPTPTRASAPPSAAGDRGGRAHGVVYNTGGIGALLRDAPVSGAVVASLREGVTLDVLERTAAGGRDWFRVRAPDGAEGWLSGLVLELDDPTPAPSAPATGAAAPQPTAPHGQRTYVVQPGDELKSTAADNGVSLSSILAANDIPDPDRLGVGQVLIIPDAR